MSEYPDSDDEFELMYGDELELMREIDKEQEKNDQTKTVRRSLNFTSAAGKNISTSDANKENSDLNNTNSTDLIPLPSSQSFNITHDSSLSIELPISTNEPNNQEPVESSNKRTIDDLFGDINDINFDELDLPSKKLKLDNEEDPDLVLINRILEVRRLKNEILNPGAVPRKEFVSGNFYDPKEYLSVNIPRWPFIPITKDEGDRFYIRFHSEDYMEKDIDDIMNSSDNLKYLLETTYKNTWEDARKILNEKLEKSSIEPSEDDQLSEDLNLLQNNVDVDGSNSDLWVERYKPKCYIELLSDESTNRTILHWLKLWDKVVFNKEIKTKIPQLQNSFNKRSGKFEYSNKWRRHQNMLNTELDDHGRPYHKMAMLCGPPGCGKTTLAHLLARQAGYRPVELNASDDRNVESFRTALQNATHMKSVLDRERRPNCLILDEIDGAPLPAIEFLVKFCSGVALSKPKKGQKSKPHILNRPIICICNDPYVPALRPLRQVALVVHFPPTQTARLTSRLCEISTKQGLDIELTALTALSDKTDNDIRACLSVLYFFRAKGKQVRLSDVLRINIGKKDTTKSLLQVLNEIFHVKLPKQQRLTYRVEDTNSSSLNRSRFNDIIRLVSSAGDYDRLVQGVFENYLEMRMRDSNMDSVNEALSWFRTNDIINTMIQELQNYSIMSYMPIAFVKWHYLFANIGRQRIKFPTQSHEVYQKSLVTNGIMLALSRGIVAKLRPFCSRQNLILDILPTLPHILTPTLKSANIQLYSESERACLSNVVCIMCDFNINYIQERQEDGTFTYNMEPDIIHVGIFDTKLNRVLPYTMKQVIAREVELEKMSRAEMKVSSAPKEDQQRGEVAVSASEPVTVKTVQLPNHMQRLQPKTINTVSNVTHKDFFGRVITASQAIAKKQTDERDLISDSRIYYHYQEGFNNAVRRNIKIQDLL